MSLRPRTEVQKRVLEHLASLPLHAAGRAYLESRGLGPVAERFRFGTVPHSPAPKLRPYAGRLVIPSIAPSGNVYDVAFRCLADHGPSDSGAPLDCKDAGCPKYLFLPAMSKRVFNTRALAEAGEVIDLTEGQLDAASLEVAGLHALGWPGAGSWHPHHRRMLQDFRRVRVWPDGDDAGRKWASQVTASLPSAEVMMVPSGKDVNTILVDEGVEGVLRIAHGGNDSEDDEAAGWGLSDSTDDAVPEWPYDSEPAPF